ncbi:hypothetical protein [Azospirillum griseum]|uniref:Lipoprotein n=1 Tax=Azospirillum griseum TaxID=2496639 RepID=A0A3S0R960_9PROT|nr:hypothetical protein [Azospirillum griseum]RTR20572.1 hypothetical protein EJ903_10645 [Azospirillum griseum]
MATVAAHPSRQWLAVAALVAALPLCACSPTTVTGVDILTLNTTRKTVGDHIASGITGKDCSLINLSETGTYCPEKVVVDRSRLYCYRTLAEVECHHIPDPYKNGTTALASPPPDIKPAGPKAKGWFDE